eukprot:4415985-Pyramimonas_sp.AAC.1
MTCLSTSQHAKIVGHLARKRRINGGIVRLVAVVVVGVLGARHALSAGLPVGLARPLVVLVRRHLTAPARLSAVHA